jgi:para-nitrobenzyl esterase
MKTESEERGAQRRTESGGKGRALAVVVIGLILGTTGAIKTPARAQPADTIVQTEGGFVQGFVDGSTKTWAGLPYAAPPVGDLRWRPPSPAPAWAGVRETTAFADQCIQSAWQDGTVGTEDCLYLNVFAPENSGPTSGLPVMVHLHPGGNFFGRAYRDADAFVQRGVVVVTLGYRLGVFGFAGHPKLAEEAGAPSGEYGVLDQIAALEWVRDNITGFGGDPGNVTLFGSSAGSFDAAAIVVSPLTQGLIHRAALQTEWWGALHGEDTIAHAEELGTEVGNYWCPEASDLLACMREIPADGLVTAVGPMDVAPPVGGAVLPRSPLELISDLTQTVPLLVGSDREEAAYEGEAIIRGDETYRMSYWYRDTNDVAGPRRGADVRRLYPRDAYDSPFWAGITMASDVQYICPIRRLALDASGPTWRYLYTHAFQNDEVLGGYRASHIFEEPFLWHDPSLAFGRAYEFTAGEEDLSANMAGYWTNFAKYDDPNGPGLPTWPRFEAADERMMVLDEPLGEISGYHKAQCDYLDSVPQIYPTHGRPS